MRKAIGVESEAVVYEIEKGAVRKFARAIGDPNPLFQDEEYAKKSPYGGIIAPPTFPAMLRNPALADQVMNFDTPLKGMLNGGNELEYFQPIRVGDTISVTAKLTDIKERAGKMGRMLFFFAEITYTNQRGEVAVKGRQTLIRHETKEE
jgi:acyl dehydratase